MLHSYFSVKDKHFKTLESLKDILNSEKNNLSITKKVKKLNEYQFFYLLSELMYHHSIEHLALDILELFFETKKTIINDEDYDDDYLPFQDFDKDYIQTPRLTTLHSHIVFNCTKKLESLVDHYLNTKKHPKNILLSNLQILSNRVLEDLYQQVSTVKYYFERYIDNEENIDSAFKINYSMEIITALRDYEIVLQKLYEKIQDKIQDKISGLSGFISNNENYIISVDNKILEKLYFGLEKFMFIDETQTSLTQFIDVLKLNWKEHNSVIYLRMNNIQFKYFIDCIDQFLNTKIPLTFIERSQNIKNINGIINASSIRASYSRAYGSTKDFESIRSIFENL